MKLVIEVLVALILQIQVGIVFSWDHPKAANPGQFPHQVSLVWSLPPEVRGFHYCGGAIINKLWILTSAFCVTNIQIGGLAVKVGRHNLTEDDEFVQLVYIEKSIVHPKYPGMYMLENLGPYDLAMLKLSTELIFDERVQPISLPEKSSWLFSSNKLNYNLVLSGWGSIANGVYPDHPKILLTVNVPVVSNKICFHSIKTHYPHFKMEDSQMCTRPLDGSLAACIGDYGGPLIQYNKHNVPEIVGVNAWSTMPCNTNGLPPIYTSVAPFVKWIEKTMKENN